VTADPAAPGGATVAAPHGPRPHGGWRTRLGLLAGIAVFAVALLALRDALAAYNFRDVRSSIAAVPGRVLLAAMLCTLASYGALVLYDSLALRYVRRDLAGHRVAFVSFIAYAFSNALGFPLILGGGVRYRFYNAWGLSSAEIALTVAFNAVTFWLGVIAVTGAAFLFEPAASPALFGVRMSSLQPVGVLLLLGAGAYLLAATFLRRPLRLRDWEFTLPTPGLALAQLAVSCVDWVLAGAVLYVLLPPDTPGLTFAVFLGPFLLAQIVGLLSHVPAGIGVFDALFVTLMSGYVAPAVLIGVLIAYRAIYYLLPLAAALMLLGVHEVTRGSTRFARAARAAGTWVPGVAPTLFSLTTFIGGAILLVSGAAPAMSGRLRLLAGIVPLAAIEASHFIGSLTGAALLVLAWGLGRRLDAAYWATLAALVVGIVASLLKGFDYEEATVLAIILLTLLPARRHFYRRASFTAEFFSPVWISMTLAVIGTTIWLGTFAFKHVDYSADLWWRFALRGDAPRALRATVGAMVVLLLAAVQRLMRPAAAEPEEPDDATLARVRGIVASSPDTSSHLALLGDKSILFSESGNAFVMYAAEGRSYVAMGDPVGPPRERQELSWQFRTLADHHGAATVFYQVRMHNLPLYLDLGLSLLKLGEEARVALPSFSLDGGGRKGLRRVVKNLDKEGAGFEVLPASMTPGLLPTLRAISDDWLAAKRTREKKFSLGFFNERYLRDAPIAVVRRDGEIVAFANLWEGANRDELSVDLMRYSRAAPEGVMEYLFIQLMLWGRAEGYAHFNLGMAPLSGLENRQLAPIWHRMGALLYRHAENFYNFQGLRAYKQKFDPVWEPRYLASPGGLQLPRILTNVASLVSGGLRGVVAK
jgi:phosphatidylglycerol lysyltransferase